MGWLIPGFIIFALFVVGIVADYTTLLGGDGKGFRWNKKEK